MKISRFIKIRDHRVFKDFTWPSELLDFARFNVLYGWNASGKTTLSNLFRHIQIRQAISEGDVDILFDGTVSSGSALHTTLNLPQVRVFNRAFIEANVFQSTFPMPENQIFIQINKISPILFLGKDSVDKQKQVEELAKQRSGKQQQVADKSKAKRKAEKALDEFCIREAKAIKELLSSSGTNPYNNYDKAHFRATCARLLKLEPRPPLLADQQKNVLKQKKDSQSKPIIAPITLAAPDVDRVRQTVEALADRTVVSQVLKELSGEPAVAQWVQQGLTLHSGDKHSDTCRFCGATISSERIKQLEGHFNDEYGRFVVIIDAASAEIREIQQRLTSYKLPDEANFYDHLASDYTTAKAALLNATDDANAYVTQFGKILADKRLKPFEKVAIDPELTNPESTSSVSAAIASVNDVIARHNKETVNFEKVVAEARTRLEEALVLEGLSDFTSKAARADIIASELRDLQKDINGINEQIVMLEKDIVEHRQPAEELNHELRSYLGRDDLKFELYGNGYQITRTGNPANDLSEGERTAIAFLYFLKTLKAKDFSLVSDVVVIDDPVSSLDANSLFCAFGYMKERTKDAGQLFILTHNFALFRQIKNWFNHIPHQHSKDISKQPCRFYMVEAGYAGGHRNAAIKPLDPLLHTFESEYHYLFKKVYDQATSKAGTAGLEEFYSMPNIARRLLETFMAFRYPAESGHLDQQLDLVSFDTAKKARILRFLHTYSHDGKIAEPEHDVSILAETPEVMKDMMAMIKTEDAKHYNEMLKLIAGPVQPIGGHN